MMSAQAGGSGDDGKDFFPTNAHREGDGEFFDIRIYKPKISPRWGHKKFVGNPVRVNGWYPILDPCGTIDEQGVHAIRWFGYCLELGMKIPEDELIKPDNAQDRKTHHGHH